MEYFWIVLLLAVGLFFLLLEIFIPSAGLLAIGGVVSLGAGVLIAFRHGLAAGVAAVAAIAVLLPLEIVFGVRLFPHTPLGRRIVLKAKAKTTLADRAVETGMPELTGKEGVTVTYLRPAGVAEIEGRRVDVVAEGLMIDVEPAGEGRADRRQPRGGAREGRRVSGLRPAWSGRHASRGLAAVRARAARADARRGRARRGARVLSFHVGRVVWTRRFEASGRRMETAVLL